MPWTLSVRLVGLPTFLAIARSDIALICDGIIFGKKLWNPFFNWLIALVFVVPFARLVGCKTVCYSCGIGPFRDPVSKVLARWVLNLCDLVIMREDDSKSLAEEIGVTNPVEVTGDAAFINPVSSDQRASEVARDLGIDLSKPLLGINVTKYMDAWLAKDEKIADKSAFLRELAEGILSARDQLSEKFECLIFSTHPMDESAASELAALVKGRVVSNRKYLSHDIQALMRRCGLFMGMRFHSVILASAVEVPIIGLIYAPKVRGYMRLLKCEDVAVELSTITKDSLSKTIVHAWNNRDSLRSRQKKIIDVLKDGALRAASRIREHYFPAFSEPSSKHQPLSASNN